MKYCSGCGKEIHEKAVICPFCGCAVPDAEDSKVNAGLVFLSVVFPFVGIILAIALHAKEPKTAKACLKAAIITAVVEVVLWLIFYFLIFGTVFAFFHEMFSWLSE